MADSNEIFSAKIGLEVDPSKLPQQLDAAAQQAEKAGEEAGKAFGKGMEKGAAEAKPGKWIGEGSDGFVGPPRPTGAAESARQMGLLHEEAAAINAGGGGGGGVVGGSAGGGGSVNAGQVVATLSDLVNVFTKFEAIGEQLSGLLFDTTKNLRDLQLSIQQDVELRQRQQATQDKIEQDKVKNNPAIDLTNAQTRRTQLLADKDASEKFWGANTTLATADNMLGAVLGLFDFGESDPFATDADKRGPFQRNAAKVNAQREAEAFKISSELAAITNRPDANFGAALGAELESRGLGTNTPIPPSGSMSGLGAAMIRNDLSQKSDETLLEILKELQKTDLQRGQEARRELRTH